MSKAVTDPKGEIYRQSKDKLTAAGYKVRAFNLAAVRHSGHFNPFDYLNQEQPEVSIAQLTECIIANTTGKNSTADGFWERAERALLSALIAYVWATTEDGDDGGSSLVKVMDLHKRMSASETDQRFAIARTIVQEWHEHPDSEDEHVMKVLE